MNKTKIDWCDYSWNPITGCLHGCEYCYARKMADRFSYEGRTLDAPIALQKQWLKDGGADLRQNGCHFLREPVRLKEDGRIVPYPFGFAPTFHRYRLDEPQKRNKHSNIFVCSMSDLFGDWVPEEWIQEVFEECERAPQHRYLFLTKNPARYLHLENLGKLMKGDSFWYGTTVTTPDEQYFFSSGNSGIKTFLSIEPIMERFDRRNASPDHTPQWIIIGAETGNRKGKAKPEKSWIDEIAAFGRDNGRPVFMKESLRALMGDDFRQEFPWKEAQDGNRS